MTEAQAWYEIAMAYYKPREARNNEERLMANSGICNALCHLRYKCYISFNAYVDAVKEIMKIVKLMHRKIYLCSLYPLKNDLLRADFCMLQHFILTVK